MTLATGLNIPEEFVDKPTDPFWWYLPRQLEIDEDVLERIWDELDRRLDAGAVAIRHVQYPGRDIRIVEVMDLIAFNIEPARGEVSCWEMEPDGTQRRMGSFWDLRNPFDGPFWLRFAFQRWAPRLSRIDFFECALNRPATIELDTGRLVLRRLRVDRRYWQMCDDVVAAINIPPAVFATAERVGRSAFAESISKLWWRMLVTARL